MAEAFKKNKKELVQRLDQEKTHHTRSVKESSSKCPRRTKDEMLRLRREMMEYKGFKARDTRKDTDHQQDGSKKKLSSGQHNFALSDASLRDNVSKGRDPKPELLDRLALGRKSKVKLTMRANS